MMHSTLIVLCISLIIFISGCAGLGKPLPPAPTVDEIVQLSQQKVPEDQIIERIRASRAVYRLSASQYAELHKKGVPDKVLDYMQRTYLEELRYSDDYRRPGVFGGIWGASGGGGGVGIGVGF